MIFIRLTMFVALIGFFSCRNNTEDCSVTEKYDDGTVRGALCLDKKTGKQTIKRYYQSGNLLAISQAKNGLMDGSGVGFYENGDTASILEFKGGKYHGYQKWFRDGYLARYNEYKEDRLIGEEDIYYHGIQSQYLYRNNSSDILYHAFFNEQGSFVVDTGMALLNVYVSNKSNRLFDFDTLSVGDTVVLLISIARPNLRNMRLNLKVGITNTENGEVEQQLLSIPDGYLGIPHQIVLNQIGSYEISVIVEREKVDTKEIKKIIFKYSDNC